MESSMTNIKIREGTIDDLPFLKQMLYEAVFWDPNEKRKPIAELFDVPEIANLLDHWKKRKGDFAFIAENERQEAVAAVWYRFSSIENPSFGFVDEDTPELGISVLLEYRKMGLGTVLMNKMLHYAKSICLKQISLSVDPKNFALSLYQRLGFKIIGESGTSWTMVKTL
jgi:ribosomal-protein-alanine N-acetyltransferase